MASSSSPDIPGIIRSVSTTSKLAQPEQFQRALADRGFLDGKAFFAQRLGGYLAFEVVVFDDQYGSWLIISDVLAVPRRAER